MLYRDNRQCPHCGEPLRRLQTESYDYERCDRCRGLWISEGVVFAMAHAIKAGAPLVFTPAQTSTRRPCPDCLQEMQPAYLFGIVVDCCAENQHGIWFDKDELAQALARVGEDDPDPPPPPTSFSSLLRDFFESH